MQIVGYINTNKSQQCLYCFFGHKERRKHSSRFSAPVQTSPGAHPGTYTKGTGYFPAVKRPGPGVDDPPTSSAEVTERVELYLYSHSGSLWSVLGKLYRYLYSSQCVKELHLPQVPTALVPILEFGDLRGNDVILCRFEFSVMLQRVG